MVLPASLPRGAITNNGPVPGDEAGQVNLAQSEDGRKWVMRTSSVHHNGPILAEVLSWSLGRRLGAHVLPAAWGERGGELIWLTEWRQPARGILEDGERYDQVINVTTLGAMIVLDGLVYNDDRHARNVLIERTDDAFKAWVIDHANAVVGFSNAFAKLELEVPPVTKHFRGVPWDLVESGIRSAVSAAGTVRRLEVEQLLNEVALVTAIDAEEARDGLTARLNRAPAITNRYVESLRGVR